MPNELKAARKRLKEADARRAREIEAQQAAQRQPQPPPRFRFMPARSPLDEQRMAAAHRKRAQRALKHSRAYKVEDLPAWAIAALEASKAPEEE